MRSLKVLQGFLVATAGVGVLLAAPRDVQFRTVDTSSAVVELRNTGLTAEDLTGWRFCSHDDAQVRQYSAAGGLDGVTLEPGASLFVHFNNDAPAGDPNRIDISDIGGGFALPLDNGPYGLQIYFAPVNFNDGNTIADHLQWNIDGVDDTVADERSDEAQLGGVWTDQNQWIATTAETSVINLKAASEGETLHGPADYEAIRQERLLVFRSLDTLAGIVELRNFASVGTDLSGWRFCSHDENQVRQYSSPAGLNGVTVEPGTSIFLHFNNDAPGGDPDRIDVSTIGGAFAQPLDTGPYGLQIYFPPVSFGNGDTIADHLQWSVDGVDNTTADERSDEAEAGGVWTDQSLWIATSTATSLVQLREGAERTQSSSPADFEVMRRERRVMIRSIDTVDAIIELHNFAATDEDLSGWRFCSHDENQVRQYSGPAGLNGVTIEAGTSIYVHLNNDAPALDPDRIDGSALGGSFSLPLDNGPFGLQIYFDPVSFGNGDTIADHLQWSVGGVDDTIADERSDEAETGGVWIDQSAWIVTEPSTEKIELKPGREVTQLHGPDDYTVQNAAGGGQVPNGSTVPGTPLRIEKLSPTMIRLTWDDSCRAGDSDFELYRGDIGGEFDEFEFVLCTTGGLMTVDRSTPAGDVYFIITPTDGDIEGSYGQDYIGDDRMTTGTTCRAQVAAGCSP